MNQEVRFREATPDEKDRWDEIVTRFPDHQVFHLSGWLKSIEAARGVKAIYLIGEQDSQIVACCPGFLQAIMGMRIFSSPREGWQTENLGPVFDQQALDTSVLIASLEKFLRRKFRVIFFELSSRVLDGSEMQKLGYSGEPIPTLRAVFPPGAPERMFAALEGKTRNQIRKALKVGLTTSVGLNQEFIDTFYSQIKEVFQRRQFALPFARSRITAVFDFFSYGDHVLPVSVFLPEAHKCIATGLFLIANRAMYLWGWAHLQEYGSLCPVDLLAWTAMEIAIEKGCVVMDFGGLGKAKRKYNALPDVQNKRWMKSMLPGIIAARSMARWAYRRQQQLRGRIHSFISRTAV